MARSKYKVEKLPPAELAWVEQRLIDRRFHHIVELSIELRSRGFNIGHSALSRFAASLKRQRAESGLLGARPPAAGSLDARIDALEQAIAETRRAVRVWQKVREQELRKRLEDRIAVMEKTGELSPTAAAQMREVLLGTPV